MYIGTRGEVCVYYFATKDNQIYELEIYIKIFTIFLKSLFSFQTVAN